MYVLSYVTVCDYQAGLIKAIIIIIIIIIMKAWTASATGHYFQTV